MGRLGNDDEEEADRQQNEKRGAKRFHDWVS